MMVFISWSKEKSKQFALETKRVLESLNTNIDAFVSDIDVQGGEDVQRKIIEQIRKCDKLVLCFTKENRNAPWLLYEAGFARGLNKTVVPVLFDNDPNWHSWIDNPMNNAREISFCDDSFNYRFLNCFNLSETSENVDKLTCYKDAVLHIKNSFRLVDSECEDLVEALSKESLFVKVSPYYMDKSAYFQNGFETVELYRVLIRFFLYSGKHLWIYGRKNMKLFNAGFNELFSYLNEKAREGLRMGGIDFRCLFLDPESEELRRGYIIQEGFREELSSTILQARRLIKESNALSKCFKLYANRREEIILRVDNVILYKRLHFDIHGFPERLTDSNFEVFSALSLKGKECIKTFNGIWNSSKSLN